jgi:hypothetical protein
MLFPALQQYYFYYENHYLSMLCGLNGFYVAEPTERSPGF